MCFRLNRILAENPQFVSGIVDIYPAVNPLGIDSITRGIPRFDLDMNRIFPGDAKGTTEEVIAAKIISDMKGAACAVDIHASNIFLREIPQVRVNINTAENCCLWPNELNAISFGFMRRPPFWRARLPGRSTGSECRVW